MLCGKAGNAWGVEPWAEALSEVLALYVPDPAGVSLAECLDRDWLIFSPRAKLARQEFLTAVAAHLGFSFSGTSLVSRIPAANAAQQLWDEFSRDIAYRRRWQFSNQHAFISALELCVEIRPDVVWPSYKDFYRARVCPSGSTALNYSGMGAPPVHLASAGRANSAGIPVLYVATTRDVAVYECRPSRRAYVAVSRVRPRKRVIRLANFAPSATLRANPFDQDASTDGLVALSVATDLGRIIGEQFARPVRESDNPHDYVATQFVAEFVADRGQYDGVVYQSSFVIDGGPIAGENVALFDLQAATVVQKAPRHLHVDAVSWEFSNVS